MSDRTPEDVAKLADRCTLEQLITSLTKRGNFNHLSISVDNGADGGKGKAFVAIFRDTLGHAPVRYMTGSDAVVVAKLALASIETVYAEHPKPDKKAGNKPPPQPRGRADDDDGI